ncbi:MAG: PIN domain-containing protein [Candidatus Bathyarchaeia archaeon]
MKAVLDTNILIYDSFEDSVFHMEARRLLDELEEWVIPCIVVHEYVWFMKGLGVDIKDVLEKVKEYLLHVKGFLASEEEGDIVRSLGMVYSEGLSLSKFNDKLILTIALREKIPIATFDAKLRGQALRKGLATLPPPSLD